MKRSVSLLDESRSIYVLLTEAMTHKFECILLHAKLDGDVWTYFRHSQLHVAVRRKNTASQGH